MVPIESIVPRILLLADPSAVAGNDPVFARANKTRWEARIRHGGLIVASAAYFVSLGCNTLLYAGGSGFLLGFVCLLFGMDYPAWYANLFLFLAGIALSQKQSWLASGFAVVATALSLSALTIQEVPRNEAGMLAPVVGYGLGFYLWVACGVILLTAAVGSGLLRRKLPLDAVVID